MSAIDRTKLNALVINLDAGKFADPELLQSVIEEVYTNLDIRPDKTETLTKTNTTVFTPSAEYHPSTKKYTNDEINAAIATVLTKTNTNPYTPSANYHPTTKKYTDDAINAAVVGAVGTPFIQTGISFPVTPTEGQTFFRSDEHRFYVYSSSVWNASASLVELTNKSVGSQIYTYKNMGGL